MPGYKSLTVDADTGKLDEVNAFAEEILEEAGCGMKTMMQISLCIEEVFVNIANYAYGGGSGTAEILAAAEDGVFTIIFKDSGIPYNPLLRDDPDITLSAEERGIGGLGIFLVKKNADDVAYEYKDDKNILTLKKRIV